MKKSVSIASLTIAFLSLRYVVGDLLYCFVFCRHEMCAAVSFGSGASVRVSKECVAAIEAVRQADLENDETVCCVLSYRPVENELQVVDLFGDNSLESAIESLNPAALQFIFCCLTDSINTGQLHTNKLQTGVFRCIAYALHI